MWKFAKLINTLSVKGILYIFCIYKYFIYLNIYKILCIKTIYIKIKNIYIFIIYIHILFCPQYIEIPFNFCKILYILYCCRLYLYITLYL